MSNAAAGFRSVVDMWAHKDLGRLSDLVDAAYTGHTSAGTRDREGLKGRIEKFHSLYSNVQFTILDQLAAGDRVATRLEASCTDSSSGKPVRMLGMNFSVFRNGRQFEEWATWEVLPAQAP